MIVSLALRIPDPRSRYITFFFEVLWRLTPVLYTSVNSSEATGILSQAISTLPLLYVEWHHTSQLLHWSCQKALVYFFQRLGLHMFLFRVDSFLSTSKPESDCHKPTTSGSWERLKQGRKSFPCKYPNWDAVWHNLSWALFIPFSFCGYENK